jgi:chromosomal replication initiator protein
MRPSAFAPLVPQWYCPPSLDMRNPIVKRAARIIGSNVSELNGHSRDSRLVRARWAVMHVMRQGGKSLPQIGRDVGGRDHTTVMHGLKRADELLASDPEFAAFCRMIEP